MEFKKRRKSKDNPYTLHIEENKYYVVFIDGSGVERKIETSEKIFKAFDEFELEDIRMMHKYERHIDHYEKTEEEIYKKSMPMENLDDLIVRKSTYEELIGAINKLTDVQKRRLKMYYFDELDLKSIALLENTSFQMVGKSIQQGIKNLKKILKK